MNYKIIVTLITIFFASFCASAKMDQRIDIIEGAISILKEKSVASIEFDWEGARWDSDVSLEEQWGEDYAQILAESEATFIAQFNKKSKALKLDANTEDATINVIFKITGADKHWGVGMGFGWETIISGTITFKSGEQTMLVLKLDRFEGDKDTSSDDSVARCFRDIAKKITKLK